MKITVESIEISGDQVKVLALATGDLKEITTYKLVDDIRETVARKIADRILSDRGPDIVEKITNNQIINSILMRIATQLGVGNN